MNGRLFAVFVGLGVVAMAFGAATWWKLEAQRQAAAGLQSAGTLPRTFEGSFIDHRGKAVTAQSLRGGWLLVYPGFTYCPDICPTELGHLKRVLAALGPAGDGFTPVLLSVDPERDTPQALAEFVPLFHPRLVGLTGDLAEITRSVAALGGTFAKAPVAGATAGHYLVNHTYATWVIDPAGRLRASFDARREAATVAAQLRALLEQP